MFLSSLFFFVCVLFLTCKFSTATPRTDRVNCISVNNRSPVYRRSEQNETEMAYACLWVMEGEADEKTNNRKMRKIGQSCSIFFLMSAYVVFSFFKETATDHSSSAITFLFFFQIGICHQSSYQHQSHNNKRNLSAVSLRKNTRNQTSKRQINQQIQK